MKSQEQVKYLLEGLELDVKTAKENHTNGIIDNEQFCTILSYKDAQIRILKWVIEK